MCVVQQRLAVNVTDGKIGLLGPVPSLAPQNTVPSLHAADLALSTSFLLHSTLHSLHLPSFTLAPHQLLRRRFQPDALPPSPTHFIGDAARRFQEQQSSLD